MCSVTKMEEILRGEKIRLPSLRGIERSKLRDAVRMVNAKNDLIYAGAVIVNETVGVQRKKIIQTDNSGGKEGWDIKLLI